MSFKIKKEAIIKEKGQAYFDEIEAKCKTNYFFKAVEKSIKKEAAMSALDNSDVTALGKVFEQVIEGLSPNLSREIVRVVNTDKPSECFHYSDTPATGDVSGSTEQGDAAVVYPITITASRERGISPKWNRSYLEDASWDALSMQIKEAGKAIETDVMDFVISEYIAGAVAVGSDAISNWAGAVTWALFTATVGKMEQGDAHPDILLVTPTTFSRLLALDQFVSSLYVGSTEAMKSGIVQTTFGLTVIRSSRMPYNATSTYGLGLLIEKERAAVLLIRSDMTVEPYEHPETNEYGFTARIRYGADTIVPKATHLISNC